MSAPRHGVSFGEAMRVWARVAALSSASDLAVLRLLQPEPGHAVLRLGSAATARVGQEVIAIGSALGVLTDTVTRGIVSAVRPLGSVTLIQTDAAINPGNSGGPLVNARGEVVGINSAIASRTGTYTGYGFAIPITLAKTVMDDIIAHGRVRRAIMGASMNEVTAEDAAVNNLKEIAGAKIQQTVLSDASGRPSDVESPAAKAGMESGDIILQADGKRVDRVSTLQRILRAHQPGDVVTLEGVRYGEKKSYKVKLVEAPSDEARTVADNPHKDAEESTGTAALGERPCASTPPPATRPRSFRTPSSSPGGTSCVIAPWCGRTRPRSLARTAGQRVDSRRELLRLHPRARHRTRPAGAGRLPRT